MEEFLTALAEGEGRQIAPGDTVVGSDRGEIGTVQEVVPPSGATPGQLLVRRSIIFEKDTRQVLAPGIDTMVSIPGARTPRAEFKLVASKMPWAERPSPEEQAEKMGPGEAEVTKLYADRSPSLLDAAGRR